MDTNHIDSLDKLQRQDHDTLIRMEAKVDVLIADLKEMKDGTTLTIADHENRLKKLEGVILATNAEASFREFQALLLWKRDFIVRWRFTLTIAAAIGGFFGFIATIFSIIAFAGGGK